MQINCDEITELKVVTVDVKSTFVYFDKLPNGKWRCVMTKDMEESFIIENKKLYNLET